MDIQTEDKVITLQNIYAPNEDEPFFFFQNASEKLSTFECEYIVIGGDFNLVQNIEKDKKGGNNTTHFKSLVEIETIEESLDLSDIWASSPPRNKTLYLEKKESRNSLSAGFFLD